MGQMAQYQMQMQGGMEDDDEPQSKRQKTEDHLIPEADFLRHHQV